MLLVLEQRDEILLEAAEFALVLAVTGDAGEVGGPASAGRLPVERLPA
jgi:hypothetical protein